MFEEKNLNFVFVFRKTLVQKMKSADIVLNYEKKKNK